MYTDPIADYLTRIRNAIMAKHDTVGVPASSIKENISKVLKDQGYINDFKIVGKGDKNILGGQGYIEVSLKYRKVGASQKEYAITNLTRKSKPGLRKYNRSEEIPNILNGLGIAIFSTSKGVMTGKQAKRNKLGGEFLCYIY